MEEKNPGLLERVIFLSDAVFGIAITLLVLELRFPAATTNVWQQLITIYPKLLSYAISFVVIAIYWRAHHRVFSSIVKLDSGLVWLNFLFLFFLVLVPFPTSVLGEADDFRGAWILYAVTMTLVGLSMAAMWGYSMQRGLISNKVTGLEQRFWLARNLSVPSVFLLSILIAFINIRLAPYTPLLLFVVMIAMRVINAVFKPRTISKQAK